MSDEGGGRGGNKATTIFDHLAWFCVRCAMVKLNDNPNLTMTIVNTPKFPQSKWSI
jgi:hypothetical protein